jgi:hypothetical protein
MNYLQTCSKCGNRWQTTVEEVWGTLFTKPATWFPLSDEMRKVGVVTCPQCGTVQSSGYRFFGILTAKGVVGVIFAILLVMVAAAVFLPRHW